MVVVQFFAADPQAPRRQVGRHVRGLEVAIAPPMTDTVDHARGPERNPDHLQRRDRDAPDPEQQDVDDEGQRRSPVRVGGVEMALDPVIRAALAVLLQRILIDRSDAVEIDALPQHRVDAEELRAMRIFLGLALGVVLAMHRDPFARDHAGRHPRPEAQHMRHDRMEIDAAVAGAAMQVQGHRENRQLSDDEEIDHLEQPARLQQTAVEKIQNSIKHMRLVKPYPGYSKPSYVSRGTRASETGAVHTPVRPLGRALAEWDNKPCPNYPKSKPRAAASRRT